MKPQTLLVLVVAAIAAVGADPALARQNRGRRSKARAVLVAGDTSAAAGANLSIRLKGASNGRWEVRLAIENAPAGLAPEAWIADADGVLVLVGNLAADDDDAGEYKLRLRGREGDPLPAGAAALADLGGRAFEIRSADAVILSGNLPELVTPGASSNTGGTGGADDPAAHDAGDDHGADGATHDANDDHGVPNDDPATHDATHDAADDSAGTTSHSSTTTTSDGGTGSGRGSNSGRGSGGHGGNDGSGHR